MESANTRAVDSGPGGIGRSPERAEELFTEELLTKLLRTAARLVNAQDADDVVQSVICRFLRSAKANTVVSAVAYLTEAVRRESLTAAAARVRRAARDRWENVDELAGPGLSPELEEEVAIEHLLAVLPCRQREWLITQLGDSKSMAETGLSDVARRKQRSRLADLLKQMIGEDFLSSSVTNLRLRRLQTCRGGERSPESRVPSPESRA